ncbi:MAG: DUF885 domain-containing protein [Polyangiaceae bacterium]|nr:DUF885 domain-containing protein [Polyangiaceae bacterium]
MAAPRDPIFELSDDFVSAFSALSPIAASMAGVPGHHDGWDDYSPEGGEAALAFFRGYEAKLAALPPATDSWATVARRVMADFLEDKASTYQHLDNLADLNNIESPVQHLRMVFDVMDTTTPAGWEAVATRLATIDRPMTQYVAALREGVRRGHVAAKRQVAAALAQVRLNASDKTSFAEILTAYDAANVGDPALRGRLERGVAHAAASSGRLASALEAYMSDATPIDAFGEDRYARASRRFLGMDIDPRETYAWGFSEIAAIESAMRDVAARIAPGKDVASVIRSLQSSPEQLVPRAEDFLELMRARQQAALSDLMGKHFEVPEPVRRIDVKLAPAGGALGAYYVPPSDGFTRPGTVYYAPAPGEPFTIFSEITTAYHEGFPGHHLQCGLQVYLAERLSRLHRLFVVCSGYAEGWALYAEQLMDELGYLDRPEYVLGMHMAKLFRAIRVVVDLGMHLGLSIPRSFDFHPGEVWTGELCVEMLTQRGFIPADFAKSEATRYLGWPGQAISYKVGERVMLELRQEARRALGDAFDLRAFHEVVLGSGSVGLAHLQQLVRASFSASPAAC